MSATAIGGGNAIAAWLNAVIVYDTFESAVKARRVLEGDRPDETTHWNVKPWRVDMLKLPPVADVALSEAADAHLILIVVPRFQSFLPWLVDWLERWASNRKVKEAGLALWDSGTLAHPRPEQPSELLQFAGRHSISLIPAAVALVEEKSSVVASHMHEREVSLTPTLQRILEQPVRDRYQHWGINE